jgi:hypothetical protein
VDQISVTPASSEAPLAAVSSAFIRVTGRCRDAIWRKSTNELLNVEDRRPAIISTYKFKDRRPTIVTPAYKPKTWSYDRDVLFLDATDDFEADETHVELLKLRGPNCSSAFRRNTGMVHRYAGLIMLILVLREDGNYSRVGILLATPGSNFKISGTMKEKTFTII